MNENKFNVIEDREKGLLKILLKRLYKKFELTIIRKDIQEIDDLLDVITIIHKYMGEYKE